MSKLRLTQKAPMGQMNLNQGYFVTKDSLLQRQKQIEKKLDNDGTHELNKVAS